MVGPTEPSLGRPNRGGSIFAGDTPTPPVFDGLVYGDGKTDPPAFSTSETRAFTPCSYDPPRLLRCQQLPIPRISQLPPGCWRCGSNQQQSRKLGLFLIFHFYTICREIISAFPLGELGPQYNISTKERAHYAYQDFYHASDRWLFYGPRFKIPQCR
jgi:hypothetical protein